MNDNLILFNFFILFSVNFNVISAHLDTLSSSRKMQFDNPSAPTKLHAFEHGMRSVFHVSSNTTYGHISILKEFEMPYLFRHNDRYHNGHINSRNLPLCEMCYITFNALRNMRKNGATRDALLKKLVFVCHSLHIENEVVCKGAIERNIDIFLYMVDKDFERISSQRICGSILQMYGCNRKNYFNWTVQVPEGKSASRQFYQTESKRSLRILHLSDFHFDPEYMIGGKAECDQPMCCQQDQGSGNSTENSCGFWSDYRTADSPWWLIQESVQQGISHDIEYVYFTGDIISHRVWTTEKETNRLYVSKIYDYLANTVKVPIYPVLGNHEPHPLNIWTPEKVIEMEFSNNWLFELIADKWSKWLGPDVRSTLLRGGYYTVSPRKGFRIIGLNNNVCYTVNWWLIFDDYDPYGQLKWLLETLIRAENANESVHILMHVPTGNPSCLKSWSATYRKIIERFRNQITGQFTGHTHRDEFQIYYSKIDPNNAIGVSYNGASITPYTLSNPSYKIYTVNATSFALLDYEEWTFNLTDANRNILTEKHPLWYKLYSFVETYGVENLEASSINEVIYRMATNSTLLDLYYRYQFRNGDYALQKGCSVQCQKNNLCSIVTTEYDDNIQCKKIINIYNDASMSHKSMHRM